MDPKQLFWRDGRPAIARGMGKEVFVCGQCGSPRFGREDAESCCLCVDCGKPERAAYRMVCAACERTRSAREDAARVEKDRLRLERAEKVESWDGWIFADRGPRDGYFESLEALIEYLEDEEIPPEDWPGFVHLTTATSFYLDIDRAIEAATDDMYEDFEPDDLNGMPPLQAAVDAFNEANQSIVTYQPDYKRAVAVPRPMSKD